mgnify:CR=1 FL=1
MRVSVAIPIHNMDHADFFLGRIMDSLKLQTFRDFEIVVTKDGKMAENTNAAIKKCKGEIIKILYMDDYLANPNALQNISDNFKGGWLATGCVHDMGDGNLSNPHLPNFGGITESRNTIGSPSVVAIENNAPLLFDERMSWLLDIDYYKRLYKRYGAPTLLNDLDIVIGIGSHQMTHILTDQEKLTEEILIKQKYA